MEFSYRISEEEYLRAARLKFKDAFRLRRVGRVILIWILVLAGLMLAMTFIQKSKQEQTSIQEERIEAVPTETSSSQKTENLLPALISNVGPFVIVVGIMAYVVFRGIPMQLRRQYRKNPAMQGQFTVNITPESFSSDNTAGASGRSGWNIFDYWREGKGLIMLVYHSGPYFLISLADLSEAQKVELRGILAAALPKK